MANSHSDRHVQTYVYVNMESSHLLPPTQQTHNVNTTLYYVVRRLI